MKNHLCCDGSQSDEMVVVNPGGPFVEQKYQLEEREVDENDGYYDALGNAFADDCIPSELVFTTPYLVDQLVA